MKIEKSRSLLLLFLALFVGCAGNRYLIDEPPVGDAQSQKAMIQGVPDQHRERLRKMLDENLRHPGNSSLLYEMGLLYQYSGKPDLAERFYRNCLQAEPRHVPAAVNLASLLTLRDRMEAAIDVLEELFSAGADDPRARTNLAILFRRVEKSDESEEQSEYVLKHFGQLYGARLNLGMNYLDDKKYELALSVFSELTREFPKDSKAHFSLGYTYQELGDFGKARAEYELSVSNDVAAFEAHNNLGLMHLFKQEYDLAEKSFMAAVRANVNFAAAHLNLGIARRNLNRLEDAEAAMRKSLALQPNLREAQYNLALLYDDYWDRPDRALTAWKHYLGAWEENLDRAQKKFINERIVALTERLERERREAAEQEKLKAVEPPPPAPGNQTEKQPKNENEQQKDISSEDSVGATEAQEEKAADDEPVGTEPEIKDAVLEEELLSTDDLEGEPASGSVGEPDAGESEEQIPENQDGTDAP